MGVTVLPSWGNFVLADLSAHRGTKDGAGGRCFEALLAKGVITRPVGNYGLPDHLRVSIGTAAENDAFLKAMAQVLPGLAA
jgi:histidinol-phosphate aminotransferase